jgi:hypothetical protein
VLLRADEVVQRLVPVLTIRSGERSSAAGADNRAVSGKWTTIASGRTQ